MMISHDFKLRMTSDSDWMEGEGVNKEALCHVIGATLCCVNKNFFSQKVAS